MKRKDWYGYIYRVLQYYPDKLKKEECPQSKIALQGITEALEETRASENGENKVALIYDVYIKRRHTLDVGAERVYTSRRTAQRWVKDFMYLCAEKMGYR